MGGWVVSEWAAEIYTRRTVTSEKVVALIDTSEGVPKISYRKGISHSLVD